jgi:hypothetical protein
MLSPQNIENLAPVALGHDHVQNGKADRSMVLRNESFGFSENNPAIFPLLV